MSSVLSDAAVAHLARLIATESAALIATLDAVGDDQWSAPPASGDASTSRPPGGIKRPTEDTTLHPRRVDLSDQVAASHRVLRDAAIALAGVRKGVERAHARWQGEPETS